MRVSASKEEHPVLLSNGDCIESGTEMADPSRRFSLFVDPHRKPCYLFALVAGRLASVKGQFKTMISVMRQTLNANPAALVGLLGSVTDTFNTRCGMSRPTPG